jgi:hypothetical protein
MTCLSSCFSDQSFMLCLRQRSNLHRLIGSESNAPYLWKFQMPFAISILRPSLFTSEPHSDNRQPKCQTAWAAWLSPAQPPICARFASRSRAGAHSRDRPGRLVYPNNPDALAPHRGNVRVAPSDAITASRQSPLRLRSARGCAARYWRDRPRKCSRARRSPHCCFGWLSCSAAHPRG